MIKEPVCQLCSGMLVTESNVTVQQGGGSSYAYILAWVCKNCSTASPIAVGSAGVFKGWKALWEKGVRNE
jgi:RNase P subunit RPR2